MIKRYLLAISIFVAIYTPNLFAFTNYIVPADDIISVEQLLDCSRFNWYERVICEDVAHEISNIFEENNILLTNNELVQYVNPVTPPRQVNTGHTCSHRAWLRDNYARIGLSTSSKLDLSGDLISKPLTLAANLPVSLYTKVNFKEKWGVTYYTIRCSGWKCRKKRKCATIADDSYYADLSASTTAKMLFSVNLQPQFGELPNGNYFIKVKPVAFVNISLDNYDANFRLHGKNSLFAALGSILTTTSSASQLFTDWLTNSPSADSRDQLYQDIGYGVLSTLDVAYSTSTFSNQGSLYERWVNDEIDKRPPLGVENVDRQLENKINRSIASTLDLDANGERVWVIDKNRPLQKLSSVLVAVTSNLL